MIRSIYCLLLRLHPGAFRARFEDEMLREKPTLRLVADALLSLIVQWTLRPQFLEESRPAPATAGVPHFTLLENSRPHTSSLAQGGILSMILFTLVGLGISHGEMPEIQSGFTGIRNLGHPFIAGLQYAVAAPVRWSRARNLPPIPMPVSNQLLQSYAAVYETEGPDALRIVITLEGGELRLAVGGDASVKLIPSSETHFATASGPTRWIEFTRDGAGRVTSMTLFRDGKVLRARAVGTSL
jgi:hypothetical protein